EPRLDRERAQHLLDAAAAAVDDHRVSGGALQLAGQGPHQRRVLERGAADLVDAHAARRRRHRSPMSSGHSSATFRFCTAWPAAPFTRLSRAEKTTIRPGAAACTEIRQSLVPTTSESRGGPSSITRTNGEPS